MSAVQAYDDLVDELDDGPDTDDQGDCMRLTGTGAQRDWPAWQVPASAVEEWVALDRALDEQREPVACRVDPERWWTSARSTRGRESQEAAVAACRACPVAALCLEYAVAAGEPEGVWGGWTAAERSRGGRSV